ncbi:MAG: magnesium transporter CorA family protein, partial [Candidatus Komeilibacteria bacterium]|nr:magnesium transporter CorA family protein [Candidatus Komeilibacteria bacterium]
DDIEYLRNKYNFHPLDLQDVLSPYQRPKIDQYDNYLFSILTFPYYNRETKEIHGSELDIFISEKFIVTISDGNLPPLLNFFNQCQLNDLFRKKYFDNNPTTLLCELINKLQLYCFPMLDHISQDIDQVQETIFAGQEKQMVGQILNIRRNIVAFRKIMQAHRNVITKFLTNPQPLIIENKDREYYKNLIEQTHDIWSLLDGLKENIEALHNTNESLISFRLNDIIKLLTIVSAIFLPVNLVAFIFTLPVINKPLADNPHSFWIILGLMAIIALIMTAVFKRKRWL